MQATKFYSGPIALTASAANICSAPTALTGGNNFGGYTKLFLLINYILVVNTGATTPTVSLYVGATGGSAAGTEAFFGKGQVIPANSRIEWAAAPVKLTSAQFLTGLASVASNTCIIHVSGEIGVE